MAPLTTPCACPDCVCTVSEGDAVLRDGSAFCSEACASGHKNQEPCHGNGSCGCTCNA
ncbi:metallothionein [Synechococcus sp. CS-197]|uniref:metallothionein n=1 Tax=Synechococcus sp. CS-197 TaxID=2847985 RepID=UPI000152526A|nr:metallothionein [Synechococcus sp. CS-197]MCT0250492.1 metallothionein [Synechococcus sp. CS-197]CAK23271.1 Metallothionein [Synechococcus sp. WH 7803]